MPRRHRFVSSMSRVTSSALALFAILLFGIPAQAAGDMQVLKLRDADHPGQCDLKPGDSAYTGIERIALAGAPKTTLLVVPCLATASDLFDVVFVEDGRVLRPMYFANPSFDLPDDNDWLKARMTQIGVTAIISSPEVDKATRTISTESLIAPGLGAGVLALTYKVRDGSAALVRFAVDLDGKRPIIIWQARVAAR